MRQNPGVDGNTAAAWVAAVGATVSAVTAVAAWRAADASAKASRDLKAIEGSRRRQELTPDISWRIGDSAPGSRVVNLLLEFRGPVALERLSSLHIKIRDDRPGRDQAPSSYNGSALTAEQIRRQVWGPLRFTPGVGPGSDRSDEDGRSITVDTALEVGEGLRFQLEPTRHPWHWRTDAEAAEMDWRAMVGTRLRLTITAFADGDDTSPWILPDEVEIADTKPECTPDG